MRGFGAGIRTESDTRVASATAYMYAVRPIADMDAKPVCRVTCYLPVHIVRRIDAERGDVPRSRWLRRVIEAHFARQDRAGRR